MKVLITYGRRQPYSPFGEHLVKAFRQAGHAAVLLCVRDRPWGGTVLKRLPAPWKRSWQWNSVEWANQLLVKAVARYRPDLVLEIEGDLFTPSTLQTITRKWGPKLGVWLVEGPFRDQQYAWLAEYNHIVSTSQVAVEQLHQAGFAHAEYLPFGTDPDWFCPLKKPDAQPRHALGFVGTYSPRRAMLLEAVSDLGVSIWGSNWDSQSSSASLCRALRTRRGIFGKDLVRCYQTSKLFLNIQREHMTTWTPSGQRIGTGLGWRHFDVPACGSLLLSELVLELPEAFAVGEEIETFSSPKELRDKARFLLVHETKRRAMIQRARERVLREHTYLHRIQHWIKWFNRLPRQVPLTSQPGCRMLT